MHIQIYHFVIAETTRIARKENSDILQKINGDFDAIDDDLLDPLARLRSLMEMQWPD